MRGSGLKRGPERCGKILTRCVTRCKFCGWPDVPCQEKKRKSSFFYMYLGKRFLESMVKKIHDKTRIFCPSYEKVLTDYDMKRGDRFRIELDHPIDPCFAIFPEGADDVPKQWVLAHFFEDSAQSVVFSRGVTLTAGQTARMNHCVLTRGLGLGHVFVHTISVTDVAHNGLRIPNMIASVLSIPEAGNALLAYGFDRDDYEASYYTCKEGRICLWTGWPQFATQHHIVNGVLC